MEWVFIFIAILLLFGGRKIPELMRGIGQGIREFNTAKASVKESLEEGMRDDERKQARDERKSGKDAAA